MLRRVDSNLCVIHSFQFAWLTYIFRYYYDKNIMTKVAGKRYAYRFDFHGLMAACQSQGQGGDPTSSAMISAASCYNKYQNFQHDPTSVPYSANTHTSLPIAGSSTNSLSTNLLTSNVKLPQNLPSTSSSSSNASTSYWTYGQFEPRPPHPPQPPSSSF